MIANAEHVLVFFNMLMGTFLHTLGAACIFFFVKIKLLFFLHEQKNKNIIQVRPEIQAKIQIFI